MASSNLPHSPYPHQLNAEGTACADDCPACRWAKTSTARLMLSLLEALRELCQRADAVIRKAKAEGL